MKMKRCQFQRKIWFKLITFAVVTALFCENIAIAGGYNNLAPISETEECLRFAKELDILKTLSREGIDKTYKLAKAREWEKLRKKYSREIEHGEEISLDKIKIPMRLTKGANEVRRQLILQVIAKVKEGVYPELTQKQAQKIAKSIFYSKFSHMLYAFIVSRILIEISVFGAAIGILNKMSITAISITIAYIVLSFFIVYYFFSKRYINCPAIYNKVLKKIFIFEKHDNRLLRNLMFLAPDLSPASKSFIDTYFCSALLHEFVHHISNTILHTKRDRVLARAFDELFLCEKNEAIVKVYLPLFNEGVQLISDKDFYKRIREKFNPFSLDPKGEDPINGEKLAGMAWQIGQELGDIKYAYMYLRLILAGYDFIEAELVTRVEAEYQKYKPTLLEVLRPKWIKVRIVEREPQADDEIQFEEGERRSKLSIIQRVKYKGKTYWAKHALTPMSQSVFLDHEAEILRYLDCLGIDGILKPAHFLEAEVPSFREIDTTKRIILFEELPPGKTLAGKTAGPKEAVDIMLKIARIIKRLHDEGVYHWDIRPSNIWLTNSGNIIVFDFNIAFRTKKEFLEGRFYQIGCVEYMTEDRFRWHTNARFDGNIRIFNPVPHEVYSLGLVLSEMLTGYLGWSIFPEEYAMQQLVCLNERADIPGKLKTILRKAISGGRCRYKTVDEFISDLEKCQKGTASPALPKTEPVPISGLRERYEEQPNIGGALDSEVDNIISENIEKGSAFELIMGESGWEVIQVKYDKTKKDRFGRTEKKVSLLEMGFTEERLRRLEIAIESVSAGLQDRRFSFIVGRETLFWAGIIDNSSLIHNGKGRIWHSHRDILKLLDMPSSDTLLEDYLLHETVNHSDPLYRHENDPDYKVLEGRVMRYLGYDKTFLPTEIQRRQIKAWSFLRTDTDKPDLAILTSEVYSYVVSQLAQIISDRHKAVPLKIVSLGSGMADIEYMLERKEFPGEVQIFTLDAGDIVPYRYAVSEPNGHRHVRAYIEETPYRNESFDVALAVFSWCYTDLDKSGDELYRILKPNGRGIFLLMHPKAPFVCLAREAKKHLECLILFKKYIEDSITPKELAVLYSMEDIFKRRYSKRVKKGLLEIDRDKKLMRQGDTGARRKIESMLRDMNISIDILRYKAGRGYEEGKLFQNEGEIRKYFEGKGFRIIDIRVEEQEGDLLCYEVVVEKINPGSGIEGVRAVPLMKDLGERDEPAASV